MKLIRNPFRINTLYVAFVTIWLTACTSSTLATALPTSNLEVETNSPVPTSTQPHPLTQTEMPTAKLWEIQKCHKAPSAIPEEEYRWIHQYIGDIEGRGEMDMLLNFTESNEILGFAFDYEQVLEYQAIGCVDGRAFTIWLQRGDIVEKVIRGGFPETDPRDIFSTSAVLQFEVITGLLMEKNSSKAVSIYLRLISSTSGTMEHRFQLAGVDDDAIILNASEEFRTAIARDDRDRVIEMLRFPIEVQKDADRKEIQTPESFLAQYDVILDTDFRERLEITFPNYIIANSGNFVGTFSQMVYSGGGIVFDEHGKVIAIYNWDLAEPTPAAISSGSP